MSERKKMTAEKAQIVEDQLSSSKKTINQIREEFGLDPIDENAANKLLTKE